MSSTAVLSALRRVNASVGVMLPLSILLTLRSYLEQWYVAWPWFALLAGWCLVGPTLAFREMRKAKPTRLQAAKTEYDRTQTLGFVLMLAPILLTPVDNGWSIATGVLVIAAVAVELVRGDLWVYDPRHVAPVWRVETSRNEVVWVVGRAKPEAGKPFWAHEALTGDGLLAAQPRNME